MRTWIGPLAAIVTLGVTFFAVPASAHVRPEVGLLPDGDTRPVIRSAQLQPPQSHNSLLEADLVVDATDNDGLTRFEYRCITFDESSCCLVGKVSCNVYVLFRVGQRVVPAGSSVAVTP